MNKKDLQKKILSVIKTEGFKVNPHLRPERENKKTYKKIQNLARLEQIKIHKSFLENNFEIIKRYIIDGRKVQPENIKLELIEVKSGTLEEIIFKWWNLIWWSIPYQRAYGRQMRFLLWDKTHNAPFGLIGLQSPILKMSVRDKWLNIPNKELDIWINKSMHAQRLGALPPYNDLLGGKMTALALVSNELKKHYVNKYKNKITLIKKRKTNPEILFITTTSAFGKSSIYNRLKYKDLLVGKSIGYTQGSGSFHIPEYLFNEILKLLKRNNISIERSFGFGPSKRIKLLSKGFNILGLKNFVYHNIKREFFIFQLVKNLNNVIHLKKRPLYYNRKLNDLEEFWLNRWAIPRSKRNNSWQDFDKNKFINKVNKELNSI